MDWQEIDILITYLPFPDKTGWQGESNRMAEIAAEYNVDFLDYYTLFLINHCRMSRHMS